MAEFTLKDWYNKEQTFDKETIYVRGTDGELMPFTHGTGSGESEEMIYYRGLAESLMMRNSKYLGDPTKMEMKGFVLSDGSTLATLDTYSFAGFKNVEGISFSDVAIVQENALCDCTTLRIIDITVSKVIPSSGFMAGALNNCPSVEAIIFRAGEDGLTGATVARENGSNDNFYIYVPSAYYDTLTANLGEYVLPKERYRKLEDYPMIDRWAETHKIEWADSNGDILKTEWYLPGTIPSYTPSKDGYMFTGWSPEPVEVAGNAKYKANWTDDFAFATCDWTTIQAALKSGQAKVWSVGNTRTIPFKAYDGTQMNVSFEIRSVTDNSVIIISKTVFSTALWSENGGTISFNTTDSNGWMNTGGLKTAYNTVVLNGLPDEMQGLIPKRENLTYSQWDTAGGAWGNWGALDKIWIPSSSEMKSWYSDNNSRKKFEQTKTGIGTSAVQYALRDMRTYSYPRPAYVDTAGQVINGNYNTPYSVSVAPIAMELKVT